MSPENGHFPSRLLFQMTWVVTPCQKRMIRSVAKRILKDFLTATNVTTKGFFRSCKQNQGQIDKKSVPQFFVHQTILNDNLETLDLGWMEKNKNHVWQMLQLIKCHENLSAHNIVTSSLHQSLTTYSSPSIYPTLFRRVFWVPRTDSQKTAVVKTPIKLFSKCLNNQERFVPTWKNPRPQNKEENPKEKNSRQKCWVCPRGFGHSPRKFLIPQQLLIHLSSPHMLDSIKGEMTISAYRWKWLPSTKISLESKRLKNCTWTNSLSFLGENVFQKKTSQKLQNSKNTC